MKRILGSHRLVPRLLPPLPQLLLRIGVSLSAKFRSESRLIVDREWYSGSQDRAVGVTKLRFWLEFMLSRIQKRLGLAGALLRVLVVLCFFPGVACFADAGSTPAQQSPRSSPGFNSTFAIADFDGDRTPDLATVELQTSTSAKTARYSIRLRLATGATQLFGVTAPAGGLQIVAQDVNGDSALDVLVSSAWLHKQVAVLLNDGHGNFTLAEPAAFPALASQSETLWKTATMPPCESAALISSHLSAGKLEERNAFFGSPSRPEKIGSQVSPGLTRPLDFSLLGRAPPTFAFPS
jgi:hypothetical protein